MRALKLNFFTLLRAISEGRWRFSGHVVTALIISGLIAFVVSFAGPEAVFRDNILYCIPIWFGIAMLSAFVFGQVVGLGPALCFDAKPENYVGRLFVTAIWSGCYVYGMYKVFGSIQYF